MKLIAAALLLTTLSGCAVTGEPVRYQAGKDTLTLNAAIDGSNLTATVLADRQAVITHHFPPFVNSRDEKVCRYRDHELRSVLKIIKGFGSTQAQVYVWVDGDRAAEFFF